MIKIILACSAGMSTSILVKKMQKVVSDENLQVEITAMPTTEAFNKWNDADIILLGPQVRYELEKFKDHTNSKIPIEVIDMLDYGMGNGEKILKWALSKINK